MISVLHKILVQSILNSTFYHKNVKYKFNIFSQGNKDLETQRKVHETWLIGLNKDICPYTILHGELNNYKAYVILNGRTYLFADIFTAVEGCFKCLTALKRWPSLCDHIWLFIELGIYNFPPSCSFTKVRKLLLALGGK